MVCLLATFVMHFLTPKEMLIKYFKQPYFSPAEIEFFSGFPFGYLRTVMFMRLSGFPNSGMKRGLTEVYLLSPEWYQLVSRIIVSTFIVSFVIMIASASLVLFIL